MSEINKTPKITIITILTVIITAYFNFTIIMYDNDVPIYHYDKMSDFLQSIAFCFVAIPLVIFVATYYLFNLLFEICNSTERTLLLSIILSFGFGMYLQNGSDYRETHRWELTYKTSLTLHETNWIDGIERSCRRAKRDSPLECKRRLITDEELSEHWDFENAKAEAAAERDADLGCSRRVIHVGC
jgi:hypothetical protein